MTRYRSRSEHRWRSSTASRQLLPHLSGTVVEAAELAGGRLCIWAVMVVIPGAALGRPHWCWPWLSRAVPRESAARTRPAEILRSE
ncbi:MAG TPA: hypothetical protein VF933_06485 [Streptosporangiaceae bacterium]